MSSDLNRPRTFRLVRDEDVSGVSGTGAVADGVRWPDGTVTLRRVARGRPARLAGVHVPARRGHPLHLGHQRRGPAVRPGDPGGARRPAGGQRLDERQLIKPSMPSRDGRTDHS